MTQDGFISFMLENDDSYMFQPMENMIKKASDDEFYRQLSRQFYGQKKNEQMLQGHKSPRLANPIFLKQKIYSQHQTNNVKLSVYKLLSKREQKQISQQNEEYSFQKMTRPVFLNHQANLKIRLTPSQPKFVVKQPRVLRLRLDDSQQNFQFAQNSHRSTLNSSTKSQTKSEKCGELYFPLKLKTDKKDDLRNLFKLSFK